MPPYLAGRENEKREFERLLQQTTILENLVLTGLRGVGKTVLLDTFKPLAVRAGWLWVGTDLSESVSVSERALALRLLTDMSVVTSQMVVASRDSAGFVPQTTNVRLDFENLSRIFEATPGLVADKLKAILELVAIGVRREHKRGIVFAYDEAQNLADAPAKDEYPLSVLLDVFQSIQRKGVPFMLALTGLPTLFPKLVEARTYAERMFRVVMLDKLSEDDSRQAILKPIEEAGCPVRFDEGSVVTICRESGGYPYFIQFVCREVYDVFIQQIGTGEAVGVPVAEITRKLDSDFFAGRWARATDRQRELLFVIASLGKADEEFTVQEIVAKAKELLEKPFGSSHVNQMLVALGDAGLIYKNRWGRYSFAVPLFDRFILRHGTANHPAT
jgi:type II secretory pathway predicted ATPase ExeA